MLTINNYNNFNQNLRFIKEKSIKTDLNYSKNINNNPLNSINTTNNYYKNIFLKNRLSFKAGSEYQIKSKTGDTIKIRSYSNEYLIKKKNPILYIPGLNFENSECRKPISDKQIYKDSNVYGLDRTYIKKGKLALDDYEKLIIQAEEAVNYISDKEKQKVTVVGFSIGGLIATHLAAKQPKNINKMILVSPTFMDEKTQTQTMTEVANMYDGKLPEFFQQSFKMASDINEKYKEINLPITIITGDKEPTCPMEDMNEIIDSFKTEKNDKKIFILKGQGHNISQFDFDKAVLAEF